MKNKKVFNYIIAFFMPILIFLGASIFTGSWPISSNSIIHFDTWLQYVPFLKMFWNNVVNGNSLIYTNELGLGTSTEFLNAYYAMNPLGFLILLDGMISKVAIIYIITIIYIGMASLNMAIYCNNRKKCNYIPVWMTGVVYSLCGWSIAFFSNSIWLFAFSIFPLIILFKEKMEESTESFEKLKNGAIYSAILGITIISNFIMAFMICIYLGIDFIINIRKNNKKNIIYFVTTSLTGAIISVPILSIVVNKLTCYSPQRDFLSANIINNIKQMILGIVPGNMNSFSMTERGCYIYLTATFLILFLLSFVNKNNRVNKIIITSIFILTFSVSAIEKIWYGGDAPDGLFNRMTFIFSFFMIINVVEYTDNNEKISKTSKKVVIVILTIIFIVGITYNFMTALLFAITAGVSFCVILKNNKKMMNVIVVMDIAVSLLISVCTNGITETNKDIYNSIKGTDFSRITTNEYNIIINNLNNASMFSTGAHGETRELIYLLNNKASNTFFSLTDALPTTSAVFGIDLSLKEYAQNNLFTTSYAKTDQLYVYQNKYSLGYGFITNNDINIKSGSNIFEANNQLALCTGADKNIYSEVIDFANISISNNAVEMKFKNDYSNLFLHYSKLSNMLGSCTYCFYINGTEMKKDVNSVLLGGNIYVGNVKAGDVITIKIDDKYKISSDIKFLAAEFDKEEFLAWYNKNAKQILSNITYSDNEYNATIDVLEDNSSLLVTIPYDKHFKAYVDGIETEIGRNLNNAMCSISLNKGHHNIKIIYENNSIPVTICISIVGWIIVISMLILSTNLRRKKLEQKLQ